MIHEYGDLARGETRQLVNAVTARRHTDLPRGIAQIPEGIGGVVDLEHEFAIVGRAREAHVEICCLYRQRWQGRQCGDE